VDQETSSTCRKPQITAPLCIEISISRRDNHRDPLPQGRWPPRSVSVARLLLDLVRLPSRRRLIHPVRGYQFLGSNNPHNYEHLGSLIPRSSSPPKMLNPYRRSPQRSTRSRLLPPSSILSAEIPAPPPKEVHVNPRTAKNCQRINTRRNPTFMTTIVGCLDLRMYPEIESQKRID
jgi:hypothetical protein